MITDRQKELAEWFEKSGCFKKLDFESLCFEELDETYLSILVNDPARIGPWLDADWCGEFLEIMEGYHPSTFKFKWHTGNNLETRFDNKASYFHNDGTLTCRLQSCVKKIIEQLPKESKQVIMGMK